MLGREHKTTVPLKIILHLSRELRRVHRAHKRQSALYITSSDSLPTSACQPPIERTFHPGSFIDSPDISSRI